MDSRIEALAGRVNQMEEALGQVPREEAVDSLEDITPTTDPDVTMCE